MKRHNNYGEPLSCENDKCSTIFQRTTQNKNQKCCSKSCSISIISRNRIRSPHSEETKLKISINRKGKNVGHEFYGVKKGTPEYDKWRNSITESNKKNTKSYPNKICINQECQKEFEVTSKDADKKYCTKKCANKCVGESSKIGLYNLGKTPAEGSGRCKWYTYFSNIIGEVKVQGTWELRFANCLDKIGKKWRTNHNKDRFLYLDEDGVERSYCPDFYSEGDYFEIKGYLDDEAKYKMNEVLKTNKNIKMIFWNDLKEMEIELFGKALSGVNTTQSVINKLIENNIWQ